MTEIKKFDYYISLINEKIAFFLDDRSVFYEQLFYCMNGGGKRLRPLLVLSNGEKNLEEALVFACVIEFIHNYSLIHDDLPAMDNDDYRRNKLTCHKKFGEANAILTGDALLNLACEIAIDACMKNNKNLLAAKKIFEAAGLNGMLKGQFLDINLNKRDNINAKVLDEINLNKTGALIKTSLQVGAILDQEKNEIIDFFGELGEKIGLAFQIKDDMFDREKIDELNYFNMIGEKEAIKRLNDLTSEIYFCLDKLDGYDFLKYLVKIILERKN